MKVLVVGSGSIGTRHIENLVALGHDAYVTDINTDNLNKVSSLARQTFESLDDALTIKPDAAFICTFSNDHINPALKCAKNGCNIFIEKPLSLSLDGIDELTGHLRESGLVSMVGCNMRFHPAISHVYQMLNDHPAFKKKLHAHLEFGYYLPFAKANYESSYMANRSMGGNLIFDDIHELDYAVWYLGEPVEVLCNKSIQSELKIDTEDNVDMLIRFKSGAICNVHMDYLQHGYARGCKVICADGTVTWDFTSGKVGSITTSDRKWSWTDMEVELLYNQMYIDEIEYFLDCVSHGKQTFNTIEQSLSVLKLALSAERSNNTGRWEKV
jgi:predicted dehydrogenase